MKKLIRFRENIFEKVPILPFAPKIKIHNDLSSIRKLLSHLYDIKGNFGDLSSREVTLTHKQALPPKSKRCFNAILNMDQKKEITHSTSRFVNFDNEDISLEMVFNFSYKSLIRAIGFVTNVIKLCGLINSHNEKLSIIKKTTYEFPDWLSEFIWKNNLQKTKVAKFIASIQAYYKKLFLKKSEFILEDEFFVSFSSKETRNEFIEKNDVDVIDHITDQKIIVKLKKGNDLSNAIKINKNYKTSNFNSIGESGLSFPNLERVNEEAPVIGILDTKIPDDSPFKNYIKVTSFLESNEVIHHGEVVSSIAFAGDQLNNLNDGCGPFNVHLFEVYENNLSYSDLIKRIKIAIESNRNIKIWNLSINAEVVPAFSDGQITDFGAALDLMQTNYNVLIIQAAGNKRSWFQKIMAPADALQSLVVNATSRINSNEPASYALRGSSPYFTKKPDVAFFGGDNVEQVKVLKKHKIVKARGTSLAAPFIARKAAHLVYYEGFSILESKAMIIHAAYINSYDSLGPRNGWGVVPMHIDEIIGSKNHHIKFVFKERLKSTKTSFKKLIIPQGKIQEYSLLMTVVSAAKLNEAYGCEYIRSVVNLNMGPLAKNKFIVNKKLKSGFIIDTLEDPILPEPKLISQYNKWKTTNCLKDIIRRQRQVNFSHYGLEAKIDKRMSEIQNRLITHDLVCVVTLIHKDKQDRYNDFIKLNAPNIVDFRQYIKGDIDLKKLQGDFKK